MEFDRFLFEDQIMKVWKIIDLLKGVEEGVLEYNWDKDKTANAIIGLDELLQMEMDKLFNMFEAGVKQKKIL